MKKTLVFLLFATALTAQASIVITQFDTLPGGGDFSGGLGSWTNGVNQFTVSSGILTVGPVSGGNPDNSGYFAFADLFGGGSLDATGLTQLSVTAKLESGNAAPGFIINLYDGDGSGLGALTATFSTGDFNAATFTTSTMTLGAHSELGNVANIKYFGIAGSGTGAAFRISFDSITLAAIPEPSAYAAMAGALALGLAVWRRRNATRA